MFNKRERPTAARQADADDGEGADLPVGPWPKRPKKLASASGANGAEGGLIGASTRRSDADAAVAMAERGADTALSGFRADDNRTRTPVDDAVRRLEVDTEVGKDTRAMHERNQAIHKQLKAGTLEAGVYRGLGGYKQYAERSDAAISNSKYSGQLGPTRGVSNVRSTLRVEYIGTSGEGGICKDYKEAGYCGFGDSCKFLHDRSDYKPSYILEKEWEEKQRAIEEKKRKRWERSLQKKATAEGGAAGSDESGGSSSESADGDALPTSCPSCNSRWEECQGTPMQTVCGHHFCEECALAGFAKSPKCMTCGAPTNGIFNACEALEQKLKQRKELKAERRRAKKTGRDARASYNISLEA